MLDVKDGGDGHLLSGTRLLGTGGGMGHQGERGGEMVTSLAGLASWEQGEAWDIGGRGEGRWSPP